MEKKMHFNSSKMSYRIYIMVFTYNVFVDSKMGVVTSAAALVVVLKPCSWFTHTNHSGDTKGSFAHRFYDV